MAYIPAYFKRKPKIILSKIHRFDYKRIVEISIIMSLILILLSLFDIKYHTNINESKLDEIMDTTDEIMDTTKATEYKLDFKIRN